MINTHERCVGSGWPANCYFAEGCGIHACMVVPDLNTVTVGLANVDGPPRSHLEDTLMSILRGLARRGSEAVSASQEVLGQRLALVSPRMAWPRAYSPDFVLTATISCSSSLCRKRLSTVRMPMIAASCPISVQLGATAVLSVSAPIRSSSPSDNEWPSLIRLRIMSSDSQHPTKMCLKNVQSACAAPTRIMTAAAASATSAI